MVVLRQLEKLVSEIFTKTYLPFTNAVVVRLIFICANDVATLYTMYFPKMNLITSATHRGLLFVPYEAQAIVCPSILSARSYENL